MPDNIHANMLNYPSEMEFERKNNNSQELAMVPAFGSKERLTNFSLNMDKFDARVKQDEQKSDRR